MLFTEPSIDDTNPKEDIVLFEHIFDNSFGSSLDVVYLDAHEANGNSIPRDGSQHLGGREEACRFEKIFGIEIKKLREGQ